MWQRVEVRSEVVEVAMVVVKVVVEGDEAKVVKLALFKGIVAFFWSFGTMVGSALVKTRGVAGDDGREEV